MSANTPRIGDVATVIERAYQDDVAWSDRECDCGCDAMPPVHAATAVIAMFPAVTVVTGEQVLTDAADALHVQAVAGYMDAFGAERFLRARAANLTVTDEAADRG